MFRRVIALNNRGVESLYCGRYQEANLFFRHAIECLKEIVEAPAAATSKAGSSRSSHSLQPRLTSVSLNRLSLAWQLTVSPHNFFEMYLKAFVLPKNHEAISADAFSEAIAVVLYNLGLVNHILGLHSTTSSSPSHSKALLVDALNYYKRSLSVFKATERSSPDYFGVTLGCLVNLGHMFVHSWEMEQATMVIFAMDKLLDSACVEALDIEDAEFFVSITSSTNEQYGIGLVAPAA